MENKEMRKLINLLTNRGIPFEVKYSRWIDNEIYPQLFYPCYNYKEIDVICHSAAYGFEQGLLELQSHTDVNKEVIGFLTAEDILKILLDRVSNK